VKTIFKLFFFIFVLAIFVLGTVYFSRVFLLEKAISFRSGLNVHFSAIDINKDNIEIKGTELRNRGSYTQENALTIQTINIDAPLSHYLDKKSVIDKVTLDQLVINFERPNLLSNQNNWSDLTKEGLTTSEAPTKSDKEVLIKHLVLKNIKLYIYVPGSGVQERQIDNISFKNIKATDDDFIKKIVNAILIRIAFQLKSLNLPIDIPENTVKGVFETVDKMLSF
jgi:hypothetical protein